MTVKPTESLIIKYSLNSPPFSAVIISSISKYFGGVNGIQLEYHLDNEVGNNKFSINNVVYTEIELIKYLSSKFSCCNDLLAIDDHSFNFWVNTLESYQNCVNNEDYYSKMNNHLSVKTFIVGHRLSCIDLLHYSFIKKCNNLSKLKAEYPHVNRWFKYISNAPGISDGLKVFENILARQVRKPFTKEEQRDNSYKGVLKNAKDGEVVTRFPPEPSGYLHIGHAKAALLNYFFAQRYNGKMIMRFDDTNPSKESDEYVESIMEDVKSLGIKYDKLTYTSDYFDLLQEYAIKLIKSGDAYCDDTDVDTMRKERGEGIESKCRANSIELNLKYFDEMIKGTDVGKKFCLRAKMDMTNKNKSQRDPVFYRCIVDTPHVRHGNKYSAYPTYDFACPIIDSIEGVTHALRTTEYSDRIPLYNWILERCNLRHVEIYEYSRLNFIRTTLSKRRLRWFVSNGIVTDWDDPRMPTVKGILRRGLTVDALLEFILIQGPSKSVNLMEWDKLWSINKQMIDPIVPRYSAIGVDYIIIKFDNITEVTTGKRLLHPKNTSLGECTIHFTNSILLDKIDYDSIENGEEVTLMKWGNAFINKETNTATFNKDGNFKLTKKKINWLPNDNQLVIPCTLKEYGHLIKVDKIDEDLLSDENAMRSLLEPQSEWITECVCESHLKNLNKGDLLQFERRGYYIIDSTANSGKLVLVKIPVRECCFYTPIIQDGKTKKK